ncbi:META domain-containing protein [Leucobacter tardus]
MDLGEQVLGDWASEEKGQPHLTFAEAGKVSGSDGCNGIGGEYTVNDEDVTVSLGAATLKACPGVDDWLRGVATVTVDGDTMQVMNADGDEIGQLQRSDAAAE